MLTLPIFSYILTCKLYGKDEDIPPVGAPGFLESVLLPPEMEQAMGKEHAELYRLAQTPQFEELKLKVKNQPDQLHSIMQAMKERKPSLFGAVMKFEVSLNQNHFAKQSFTTVVLFMIPARVPSTYPCAHQWKPPIVQQGHCPRRSRTEGSD